MRPGAPGEVSCELVSVVENRTQRGIPLSGWGPAPGLGFHLVTSYGQKLFDGASGASGPIRILPAGERWTHHIGLGQRGLVLVEDWSTPPLRELAGLSDSRLELEDHLWLVPRLHQVQGPILRIPPIAIPLATWRRNHETASDSWALGDWDRVRCTDLVYRPGRLMASFSRRLPVEDARRVVEALGYSVHSSRLYERLGVLVLDVPRGREAAAAEALEAQGVARMVSREPIVCGLSG